MILFLLRQTLKALKHFYEKDNKNLTNSFRNP